MDSHAKKSIERNERHVTVMIHEVSLMVARKFNRRMKDIGLTRTQWQVLYLLYQHDGQTQTELADTLSMGKPPLGKVVDRLQEDGWIVRIEHPNDRRAKKVHLTDKVRPLVGELEAIVDDIGEVAMAGMTTRDRNKFHSLMRQAHANLSGSLKEAELRNG